MTETKPQHSIIRRSSHLLCFTAPAMALNLVLQYLAAWWLPPARFGVFYLAISLVNTIFAPAVILNLFIVRHIAGIIARQGTAATWTVYRDVLRRTAIRGLMLLAAVMVIALLVRASTDPEAVVLIVLVMATAYSAYLVETARAGLQAMHAFTAVGVLTMLWMASRFAFGAVGLYAIGSAWAGMLGIALANAPALLWGVGSLRRRMPRPPSSSPATVSAFRLRAMMPMALSYGGFIAISYLDILLGYIILAPEALGRYAATAILPKGILIATTPVLQVLFPVVLRSEAVPGRKLLLVLKALAFTILLVGMAVLLLHAGTLWVCGGWIGLRLCQSTLFGPIAWSILPLCLLRVVVVAQFARGRDLHPLWLIPFAGLFVMLSLIEPVTSERLASGFLVFSWLILLVYTGASIPYNRRLRVMVGEVYSASREMYRG